jgi:hypothetical protein
VLPAVLSIVRLILLLVVPVAAAVPELMFFKVVAAAL